MFGFFNELKEVIGLNSKEIFKAYKVAFIEGGGVLISNFIKILTYSPNLIVLKVRNNVLNIEGVGFEITELSKDEIIAKGSINKIYLSKEFIDEKKQTKS